jgi:ribonuclease HI
MSGKLKINPFVSKAKPYSPRPNIEIYVDGASLGNPGYGGAGVVILTTVNGERQKTAFGAYLGDDVTNNRAEITAAILSLQRLTEPSHVTLYSDSEYVINTMTLGWKKNKNKDLWAELDAAAEKHDVTWKWVRGHAGDEFNELAHTLADLAAEEERDVTEDDVPAPIVTDAAACVCRCRRVVCAIRTSSRSARVIWRLAG